MAKNFIQDGQIMTWTNGTGSAVAAGAVVVVGTMICIALGDIANGATGELATEGVWQVAKNNNLVIAQGDIVYWDTGDANVNKTAEDNYQMGHAFVAATQTATTVKVKLGSFGLLTNDTP